MRQIFCELLRMVQKSRSSMGEHFKSNLLTRVESLVFSFFKFLSTNQLIGKQSRFENSKLYIPVLACSGYITLGKS